MFNLSTLVSARRTYILKETLKAYDDFKNKQKNLYEVMLFYM